MTELFDPLVYWEHRHSKFMGDHRNVGNKGLTSEQNRELILAKSVIVAHALGIHGVPLGAKILDAGCGAGAFTDLLQQGGFEMTGVDSSTSAISAASALGRGRYQTSAISSYNTAEKFDAVLCLDVLYHVINEFDWSASLASLCKAVSDFGLLLIIENFDMDGPSAAPHVRWRTEADYSTSLAKNNFSIVDLVSFQYPHEGIEKTLLMAKSVGSDRPGDGAMGGQVAIYLDECACGP